MMCITRGSGPVEAPDCGAPASSSDFAAGLIRLSLAGTTCASCRTGGPEAGAAQAPLEKRTRDTLRRASAVLPGPARSGFAV